MRREVIFYYTNWKGISSFRRVKPISVQFTSNEYHKKKQYILKAFDLEKNAERTFTMKDISKWNENIHYYKCSLTDEHNSSLEDIKQHINSVIEQEKEKLAIINDVEYHVFKYTFEKDLNEKNLNKYHIEVIFFHE